MGVGGVNFAVVSTLLFFFKLKLIRHMSYVCASKIFFKPKIRALQFIPATTIAPIFASQGLRFESPFSPPLADLEYILKFACNATWWFIEVAPLR